MLQENYLKATIYQFLMVYTHPHFKFHSEGLNLATNVTSSRLRLHNLVEESPPPGPAGDLGAIGTDGIPVELTAVAVDVHLAGAEPALTFPQVTDGPEEQDDGSGEEGHEETLSIVDAVLAGREERCVELCHHG